MIEVPKSTVERPLTAIDFIASLESCTSISEVQQFSAQVSIEVRQDDRFARAVAKRLSAIRDKKAAA